MRPHFDRMKRIFKGLEYPDTICISYSLKMLTFLGQWQHQQQTRRYWTYLQALNCAMIFHVCTLMWDLCVVYNDIILFGDDMCVVSGVALVMYKKFYHNYYSVQFEQIFEQLKRYSEQNNQRDETIRKLQRKYHIEEYVLIIGTIFLGLATVVSLNGHALFDSTIPLRAIYPIELDTDQRIIAVTIFQFVMSIFLIEGIVFFDGIGGQVMSQMTLHFHVLCIDFQRIGSGLVDSPENDSLERKSNSDKIKCDLFKLVKRHQELILFGHRANALYQPMLLAQLICSLAMICLTAFEATLTTHDPLLFLKFAMFAVSVLIQILYWCYYGNRVSHMSTEINNALISSNWIVGNNSIKKDYKFVMMRAQKPFRFIVYNYFPISYETFISVLSRSYSFFTLFRTISD
ncbi:odorant receptor 47b isoform X1 [Culex quinquefasciatus]|uniref:odorant receptor 47b isoform X1 n=1 Tax=Culex quinquefasciatus TaxID=7176 RepID=UPI0018E33451|nr:odorant receptor 47b isoform X1 [Culex quinquefasciatus]